MRILSRFALPGLVGATSLVRVPALLSTAPLSYDDGVYGASILSMRHGALPFRDVFSSQGPLFLPLAWLFDLIGFRASWAPRLVAIASGVALVGATFVLAKRAMGEVGAIATTTLVAFSPLILDVSAPLSANGPTLAFATSALAAAEHVEPEGRSRLPLALVGALIGCALAIKGPIAAAPGIAALWIVMRRRGIGGALASALVAGFVPIALSLPWGLRNVWEQFVVLHLRAESFEPILNAKVITHGLLWPGAPLILFLVVAVWLTSRNGGLQPLRRSREGEIVVAALIWLVLEGVVLLLHSPLFTSFVSYLVVPLALLVGVGVSRARRPLGLLAVMALLAVVWLVRTSSDLLRPLHPQGTELAAISDLRADVPPSARVVTDEQGLAWWAGRLTPDDLVDTSHTRIEAGFLTLEEVVRAAETRDVCGVLIWSGRFATLGDVEAALLNYHRAAVYGPSQVLLIRDSC